MVTIFRVYFMIHSLESSRKVNYWNSVGVERLLFIVYD